MLSYERYKRDLRPWGGKKDARVVDNVLQEIDLKTGLVEFEWHSFGNISPNESNLPAPTVRGLEWEYFHLNSASLTPDGNFLISARNTSGIYEINRQTGKIMWRLGGKKSDFKLGKGVRFDWQHSPRMLADGKTIELFDDSAAPPTKKASRAETVRLDTVNKTATLVPAWEHPLKLLSASQGNVQPLENGDTFVGWGSQRYFTEYSPTGQVLFDGHLAKGNDNYRAFRMPVDRRSRATPPKVVATPRPRSRARELERRDRASRSGSCSPARARRSSRRSATRRRRASRPRSRPRSRSPTWRCARSTSRATCSARRAAIKPTRSIRRISPRAEPMSCLILACGQLAARRVDVAAAREANRGAQAVLLQHGLEGVDRVARGPVVDRVRRVVRDQVELVDLRVEQLGERDGLRVAVVDAREHHVLDEDLAALALVEALARVEHLASG